MAISVREKVRGSGVWWIFGRHKGKRFSKLVGSRVAANQAKKKLETALAVGDFVPPERKDIPTVKERWEFFYENYLRLQSPSKRANYKSNFETHILPAFGSIRMDEVTDDMMESFITELVVVKKLGRNTVATIIREFARLYSHAKKVVDGYNPCKGLSHLWANATPPKAIFPFTREESALFLRTAFEYAPDDYCQFLACLHSGTRPGESAGLQWLDVDWFRKQFIIRRSIDLRHNQIVETKTKKDRHVDIPDELIEELKRHRARQREYWLKKGMPMPVWVFPGETGSWQNMNNLRERSFARVLAKAGLGGRDLYDMRHTYASQLLQAGAKAAYVAKQCGHSVKILLDVYAHYLPEDSDRAFVNQLPGLAFGDRHPSGTLDENGVTSAVDGEVLNA